MISRQARAEAAVWLARLHGDTLTDRDQAGYEAWLAESLNSRLAMAEITAVWESAGAVAKPLRRGLSKPDDHTPPPRSTHLPRRALLAGGMAAAAAAVAVECWPSKVYATGIGETSSVALEDGSTAMLDACTRFTASFTTTERRLDLTRGRVALTIARTSSIPFVVSGNGRQVVALGSVLQITNQDGCFIATALKGDAVMRDGTGRAVRINSGERLSVRSGETSQLEKPALDVETAWQSGQLMFVNESLAAAVDQFNRYNIKPIQLADPVFGRLRVSGVFRARAGDAFARSVAELYGLELVAGQDRLILQKRRPTI